MSSKKWTDKEVSFLQRNYGKLSNQKIADELGRTKYAVESKAAALRKVIVGTPKTAAKGPKTTVVPVQAKKPKVAKVVINKPKNVGPANPAFSGEEAQPATQIHSHSVKKRRKGIFGFLRG